MLSASLGGLQRVSCTLLAEVLGSQCETTAEILIKDWELLQTLLYKRERTIIERI
jgi:hypothetical protein